jgi:microcystin degradation protein MlrC
VVAHGWNQAAVDGAADGMMRAVALQEPSFAVPMVSPEAGVAEAQRLARGAARPVVLADTQDNPAAAAPPTAPGC